MIGCARNSADDMIENDGHWEGCWQAPGHHDCAIRIVEGFKRRFGSADLRQVENLVGYGLCVRVPGHWRLGDIVRLFRVEESMPSKAAESDLSFVGHGQTPMRRDGENSRRS